MPSVTFCFSESETKDLNSFFNKASFSTPYGLITNLTGEQYNDTIIGDCVKFNHFTNKSDVTLFSANSSANTAFLFEIDAGIKFSRVFFFLADNYNNVLDWSQFVTFSYYFKSHFVINIKKEVDIKLEEPFNQCKNVSDVTYRQSNCLCQCKNEQFANKHNCTLKNYFSTPGYSFCNKDLSSSLEFDSVCKEQCPKECTTTKFEVLLNDPNLNTNSSNILSFNVYYLDLSYIEITQTPKMSGYSLMNEIGGALGLFIGILCLSFIEFLEFFFEVFLVFLNSCCISILIEVAMINLMSYAFYMYLYNIIKVRFSITFSSF